MRMTLLALSAAAALAATASVLAQDAEGTEEATIDAATDAAVAAPRYVDLRRITPITGDPVRGQARSEVCSACHGPEGISVVPIYPDIAGQRADYLYWQLVKFKSPDFGETVMAALVADLSEQDMRDLSMYYAGLPAAGSPADPSADADAVVDPAPAPDPELLARGEQLYRSGDPAAGIPPCQACHGGDARGHPLATEVDRAGFTPYAAYPSLRGQRDAYLVTRINEYRERRHASLSTDFVMGGAAQNLDDASVEAIAAWLSSLPR
jgi:cytochrome c553